MHERVLAVEDDEAILELITFQLRRAGFEPRGVTTGGEARALLSSWRPDVVILDLMLPDASGLDLCREVRERGRDLGWPGIIILTALNEEGDRITGLEVGADDYVTKPFSPRELVARVRALVRRRRTPTEADAPAAGPKSFGRLTVDVERLVVTVDGHQIAPLTATEFRLLAALVDADGRVQSRDQLTERVWGGDFFGDQRTVDVHVRHIREKLERAGAGDVIETVRGFGYRLVAPPDDEA